MFLVSKRFWGCGWSKGVVIGLDSSTVPLYEGWATSLFELLLEFIKMDWDYFSLFCFWYYLALLFPFFQVG